MQQTVLVTGAGGQLGQEVARSVPQQFQCVSLARGQLDLSDATGLARCLDKVAPQQVINAAAYTAVDAAETDTAAAWRGNEQGPRLLAQACAQRNIRLLHVSTDFVFDGESAHPYTPDAPTAPLGEYGRSKLAGEQAVLEVPAEALILRTGWVYSRFGANFVKTMLRLMASAMNWPWSPTRSERPPGPRTGTGIVGGGRTPGLQGIYHWSDAGVCSWYDFAVAICEEA